MMKLFPSTEISVTSADVTLISYIDHLHQNTDPDFLQKLSTLIPTVYKITQQEDNNLPIESFKHTLKLSTISPSTMSNWLKYIGFKYKEHKKCYFNDKHENEENIKAREEFISSYLELELCAHHWVHISECNAVKLEEQITLKKPTIHLPRQGNFSVSIMLILTLNYLNMLKIKTWEEICQ